MIIHYNILLNIFKGIYEKFLFWFTEMYALSDFLIMVYVMVSEAVT